MQKLIVQKYGGTSVANAERILNAAKRITAAFEAGNRVVVVVSAQGSLTDRLVEKAYEVNPQADRRELDMLLVTGEQQAAALMSMAIKRLGYNAVSLNAQQIGIEATSQYGNAQIKNVLTKRLLTELDKGNIVVAAGFQGVNKYGDLTTLGRGASDTTAVALAAVLKAEVCEMYTDVDGIYTADPRIVPTARKFDKISYDDMIELASGGVRKPHNRAVEMGKRYNVKILVRSSLNDSPGTWIMEGEGVERLSVSGLAIDRNVAKVAISGDLYKPGSPLHVFTLLAAEKITVDVVLQLITANGKPEVCFTVHKQDLASVRRILEMNKDFLGVESISTDESLAKLSVTGSGMSTNSGIAAATFEALHENGVVIHMISCSEIKISILVDEREIIKATNAVHGRLLPMTI